MEPEPPLASNVAVYTVEAGGSVEPEEPVVTEPFITVYGTSSMSTSMTVTSTISMG